MWWGSLLASLLPGRQDPIREASEQRHNKSAKLQTALEATMVNSLNQIDRDEREVANAYRNWKVFGDKKVPSLGRGGDEEMLVADNIYNIKPPSIIGPLLGLSALLGTAGGVAALLIPLLMGEGDTPPPQQPTSVVRESEVFDYGVESRVIPPDR